MAKHIYATHTKDVAPLYGVSPKEWYFFACVPVGQGIIGFCAQEGVCLVIRDMQPITA